MTRLMHGNQHSHHPKKHKKQPETQKQVGQWITEDSRFKTKRNRVDKLKSLKKKKIEDVQTRKLIAAPFKAI